MDVIDFVWDRWTRGLTASVSGRLWKSLYQVIVEEGCRKGNPQRSDSFSGKIDRAKMLFVADTKKDPGLKPLLAIDISHG
jgi:hypothetical protein